MPVFQKSSECLRAQYINDLREQELQTIRQICNSAARMIVAQNYRDLAIVLNRVGRE